MTVSNVRKNLRVDVQGTHASTRAGERDVDQCITRILTVKNRGQQQATLQLLLKPDNAKFESLRDWCTWYYEDKQYDPNVPILLDPKKECEVKLIFNQIPSQTEPGSYDFEICAQAREYFGEIVQRSQRIQVLPSDRYLETLNEPKITLNPDSSSDNPHSIPADGSFPVTVTIESYSDQVERFFLNCPELENSWFNVEYSNGDSGLPEAYNQSEGLRLYPKRTGTIKLTLTPPRGTLSGHYSSTLRIRSEVRDDLVLLSIIYFKVEEDIRLALTDLSPQTSKLSSSGTKFQFLMNNLGNTKRTVELQATDDQRRFKYIFESDAFQDANAFQLSPGQYKVDLSVKRIRKNSWEHFWRKDDLTIPFDIQLKQVQDKETDGAIPIVPVLIEESAANLTGTLIWKSFPKWWLWMLIWGLLAAGLLAALYALWKTVDWGIQEYVIKPSLRPQLLEVAATKKAYQEGKGDQIRLNWDIKNPEQLTAVRVTTRQNQEQKPPYTYSRSALEKQCARVAAQPDNSLFRSVLTWLYPDQLGSAQWVMQCRGMLPQEIEQDQSQGSYEFTIDSFRLDDRSQTAVKGFQPSIGRVADVVTGLPVQYQPLQFPQTASLSKSVQDIQVTPAPPPAIVQFASKMPAYRVADAEAALSTNAQEPFAPIQLNWSIENPTQIQAIDLRSVYVAPDGSTKTEQKRYSVQDGKVAGLENYCKVQNNSVLNCQDVPVAAPTAGQYNIFLSVALPSDRPIVDSNALSKNTGLIQVKPPLPEILGFQINGQDTLGRPKKIFLLNPLQGPINVTLSWQVKNPDLMKVELLPAPGVIDRSQPNKMTYALSPNPSSTTATLRVTNAIGEVVERTLVLETAVIPSAPQPPTSAPAGATPSSPGGSSSAPPPPSQAQPAPAVPSNPEGLPPYELPPRTN
jgi:hypothetical protein